ncbi:alpha/beta fold hydrolase [Streptomyces sp. NPDC094038]|uniref:alpha/beta fold hydrolase n=1 Tax=Streptomyces sp. NPDC094038 TaxID=3366055 RepID=UPI003813AE37
MTTDGGDLHVRDYAGSGPAFVMLHGFPDNLRIFEKVAPLLVSEGRRVVLFDFLGFGGSDKPGRGYSFEQQVADLLAVADALDLDRIVPVAHDAGGPAAVNFALRHSRRTAEVALLNCFYGPAPTLRFPEFIEFFATPSLSALSRHFLRNPALFAELLQFQRAQFRAGLADDEQAEYEQFLGPIIDENFRRHGAGPAFAQMTSQLLPEVARNDQRLVEVERLDVPFRLIWGAEDPYLNVEVAEDLAGHLRAVTTTILKGAGHWPQIDRPGEVAQALLSAISAGG